MFKSPLELAIIALVMFLLFGAKKLPEAARSIGQSFKIFKEEINSVKENVKLEPTASPSPEATEVKSKE
jgi:sec-independent protein translocase protein TatA